MTLAVGIAIEVTALAVDLIRRKNGSCYRYSKQK